MEPKIRVRAVIVEKDQILTLERQKEKDHFWCFPGGGVEEGESEQEALIRECMEEINIKVRIKDKIFSQDFEGDKIYFYLCEIIQGKAEKGNGPEYHTNNKYIGKHKPVWLPLKDLKKYDLRPNELRDIIIRDFNKAPEGPTYVPYKK